MPGRNRGFRQLLLTCLAGAMLLLPNSSTQAANRWTSAAPSDVSDMFRHAPPKRLLVIAPHPDDESLAAMALVRATLSGGGVVRIVCMTNGDGYRGAAAKMFHVPHPGPQEMRRLGLLRQREELQAVQHLGLPPQSVTFLGYPDAGLHRLWQNNWLVRRPYLALNGATHVPYANAYHPQAPYSGESVVADLSELIRDFLPTDILYPDPHDVHRDHWATSAFTQYVLTSLSDVKMREWNYLIHYPDFPDPRRLRKNAPLLPPVQLQDLGVAWLSLPLSTQTQADKQAAILAHRSQIMMMKDLLLSFVRTNDLLSTYSVPTIPHRLTTVALDAKGDQQVPRPTRSADLRELRAAVHPDTLVLALRTADRVRPEDELVFHLRLPDAPPGQPILVSISNRHKQHLQRLGISWSYQGQFASCTLPRSLVQGRTLMISAELHTHGQLADSTAWRRFHLY